MFNSILTIANVALRRFQHCDPGSIEDTRSWPFIAPLPDSRRTTGRSRRGQPHAIREVLASRTYTELRNGMNRGSEGQSVPRMNARRDRERSASPFC